MVIITEIMLALCEHTENKNALRSSAVIKQQRLYIA